MATYGPNETAVRRLVDAARYMLAEDARALIDARIAWVGASEANAERAALRAARIAARRAGRVQAFEASRAAAAQAYRDARRGWEVLPWLGVSAAITNAISATVVGDLLDMHSYEVLYRPWREAMVRVQLVPVGPGSEGHVFGVAQRRRVAARSAASGDR